MKTALWEPIYFDSLIRRPANSQASAADEADWRRSPSTFSRFTTKINGLLKHTFNSRPVPEWEREIASRPGIIMHPRVSKLAQSASGKAHGTQYEDFSLQGSAVVIMNRFQME